MNNFVPWFVTSAVCGVMGMVFWSYFTFLPVKAFDIFLMGGMSLAAIGIVRGYFTIYEIFDRMDKREQEWEERERAIKTARKLYR